MNDVPVTDLVSLLAWASTPAGLAAIGGAVAIFLKDVDWFENLSSKNKSLFMFILCIIVIPMVLVYIPSKLPETALTAVADIFNVLILGATAYLSSQGVHEFFNQRVAKRKNGNVVSDNIYEDDDWTKATEGLPEST